MLPVAKSRSSTVDGPGYVLYALGVWLPGLRSGRGQDAPRLSEAGGSYRAAVVALDHAPESEPELAGAAERWQLDGEVRLLKRFSEVLAMHKVVAAELDLPPPPSKLFLSTKLTKGRFDKALLVGREAQLQQYFDALLLVPGIDDNPTFRAFVAHA